MNKNRNQRLLLAGVFATMATAAANAQTDITGVANAIDGYVEAGIAIGVTVLLFTLGRAVFRKLAR